MQAVVLVGGKGTRLRPLTLTTPKPLVPLANRPLIEHIVRWLEVAGVEEVFLLTQFKAQAFEDWITSWRGMPVRAVEEPVPLGTAGAVVNVAQFLHGTAAVVNGDNITDLDLRAMERVHRSAGAYATIAVDQVDDPTGRGVVVAGPDGRVSHFQEKPAPGTALATTVNTGTYLIEPQALMGIAPGHAAMWETDLFPALITSGARVQAFRAPHRWLDAGTARGYLAAQRAILEGAVSSPAGTVYGPGATITWPVAIAENSSIEAGSVLEGPSSIGAGCRIEAGAKIVQSAVWDGCLVEAGATVANSIIGYNCTIGRQAQVDGALLGDGVIVRAGVRLRPGTTLEPRSVAELA
jgi:NDP-sugar pyrophosphorylase family protein